MYKLVLSYIPIASHCLTIHVFNLRLENDPIFSIYYFHRFLPPLPVHQLLKHFSLLVCFRSRRRHS